jgi:hypothetical protein
MDLNQNKAMWNLSWINLGIHNIMGISVLIRKETEVCLKESLSIRK